MTPEATVRELRDARNRLAFELHPDRGGDAAAMQRLNVAFAACLAELRRPHERPQPAPPAPSAPPPVRRHRRLQRVEIDSPSFTIDALPAEAFEALLVVAATLGDVVDDDPPYVLECVLAPPLACWCRLDLVPDAGASTVSLAVAAIDGGDHPPAEDVRDVWVAELNQLGRPLP